MSVKKDKVQVDVTVDGKQGINELGRLEIEAKDLRMEMKNLKRGTAEYTATNKKLREVKTQITALRKEMGLAGMTMQQLRRYQRDLSRELSNSTTKGTARYNELKSKIREVNGAIKSQRLEVAGTNSMWGRLSREVKQFGVLALGYLGITELTNQVNNLIRKLGQLSDDLAAVRKTTGLTAEQVDDLNSSFKTFDTRTARKELLSMAKIAGKLGVTSRKDVEGFVKAADMINVALGEDLGAPEENLRKLGKLVETFKVKEVYGIEDSLIKVGSAINHLGKSSTANEGFIVEFTKRMGGIAPLANISIQNIMGLGAATDALGLTSEVTTTALNKLFIKMSTEAQSFYMYARNVDGTRMSLQEFKTLIDKDMNEAFFSLLRGVRNNSEGMNALSKTLADLELDGSRVVNVLGTLANNQEFIATNQKIANDEFRKGTSILGEFELMNETLGAKLDKLRKRIFAAFVNPTVIAGLEKIVDLLYDWVEVPLSQTIRDEQAELNRLSGAIIMTNDNQEIRNKLIEKMQDKYPDFLGNIDAESVSNQMLRDRMKEVNEQYRERITLALIEEDYQQKMRQRRETEQRRIAAAEKLAEMASKARPSTKGSATLGRAPGTSNLDLANQKNLIAQLDAELAELDSELIDLEAEKIKIDARLFFIRSFDPEKTSESGGDPKTEDDPVKRWTLFDLDAAAKEVDDLMKLGDIALRNMRSLEIQKREMNRDTAEYNILLAEHEFRRKSDLVRMTANEYSQFFEGVGGMFEVFGKQQEDLVGFYIASGIAQVIADQGVAMAAAVRMASQNSITPIDFGIKLVALMTAIGTQIANAKRMIDSAKEAAPRAPSFYDGTRGMPAGDEFGRFAGYTHYGEDVVSVRDNQDPVVMNLMPLIRARQRGESMRLTGASGGGMQLDASQMDSVVKQMEAIVNRFGAYVDVIRKDGIPAYFRQYEFHRAKEHEDEFEKQSRKGDL